MHSLRRMIGRCVPEAIAEALALATHRDANVPFTAYSKRYYDIECTSGKVDDITVVANWIVAD